MPGERQLFARSENAHSHPLNSLNLRRLLRSTNVVSREIELLRDGLHPLGHAKAHVFITTASGLPP